MDIWNFVRWSRKRYYIHIITLDNIDKRTFLGKVTKPFWKVHASLNTKGTKQDKVWKEHLIHSQPSHVIERSYDWVVSKIVDCNSPKVSFSSVNSRQKYTVIVILIVTLKRESKQIFIQFGSVTEVTFIRKIFIS